MIPATTKVAESIVVYFNGVVSGFLFGIGLFVAAVLVKALFHLPLLG